MSELLHAKIASVRSKQAMLSVARGLCGMVAAACLLLAGTMLVDYFVELPRWARAAMLAVDVTVLTYILLWYVVAPFVFGPDDEEIALLVERHRPEFRTRLIASIQLSREGAVPAGASRSLVGALVSQTEEMSRAMNFADVVRSDAAFRTAAVAALVVILLGTSHAFAHRVSSVLLRRALLSEEPVPRDTRVVSRTEDLVVAIGDAVRIEASAEGVVPASGTVRLSFPSGRPAQVFPIEATPEDRTIFVRTIDNVQESFEYRVQLNDGHGRWHRVTAVPRPAVAAADFVQKYPAYTRLPDERKPPGHLALLAGSKLTVRVRASKPVASGAVQLVGLDRRVELAHDPAELAADRSADKAAARAVLVGTVDVPARGLSGLAIHLVDDHKVPSRGETMYPVDLVADRPPTVDIVWPRRREEQGTQQVKALVSFEAKDDYGIDKVFLHYAVGPAEGVMGEQRTVELDLGPAAGTPEARAVLRRHEFDLAALQPQPYEGSIVEYWLELRDANDVTGPGKVFSDRYRIRVVSELEKRAELMNQVNDQLGTIDFVTQDQEKLEKRLGAIILEKK